VNRKRNIPSIVEVAMSMNSRSKTTVVIVATNGRIRSDRPRRPRRWADGTGGREGG
jgi:hypothetical protein